MNEEWRGLVGYESYYRISNTGLIWSIRRNRLLSCKPNKYRKYVEFCIKVDGVQRTMCVHQEVAKAFLGPARGRQVRHLDGDPLNNNLNNLAYGMAKENQEDRRKPDYKGKPLLTESQIKEAEKLVRQAWSYQEVADKFGVSYACVRQYVDVLPREINKEKIWACIQTGAGVAKIAEAFNITHGAIVHICRRHYKPIRQLRKTIPLNKSISTEQLRNIIQNEK